MEDKKDRSEILFDIYGNELHNSCVHNRAGEYVVFGKHVLQPIHFNTKEQLAYSHYDDSITIYGVLNVETGEVIIPPAFSEIKVYSSFDNLLLSIVSITNYYQGNKTVYVGLYADSHLIIPVGCEEIAFMEYENKNEALNSAKKSLKRSNYIRIVKDEKIGLVYYNGVIVVDDCDNVQLLYEGESRDFAIASRNGRFALIYRDKVVTDFELDAVKGIKGEWVKVWKEGKTAIYCCDKQVTAFYSDIHPYWSKLYPNLCKESFSDTNVVFVVSDSNKKKGLHNINDEEVLPCVYITLKVYNECLFADGKYIDDSGHTIFNTEGYELHTSVESYGNFSFCYVCENNIVFVETDSCNLKVYDRHNIEQQYVFQSFKFDFEKECFVQIQESFSYYSDYDDYDYERENYYALGGNDYDSFKDRGGNIDDMMDGNGF